MVINKMPNIIWVTLCPVLSL